MNINNLFLTFIISSILFSCQGERNKNSNPSSDDLEKKSAMILGVYHFNNPGMDTHNMEIDDYFSDKRQAEIKEVVDLLSYYKPTKIFVEFSQETQAKMDSLYNLYLEDKLTLKEIDGGKNEVYQIGFRLGKKLNGIKILAIDHSGNWLGPYADFIADTLELEFYNENQANKKLEIKARQKMFSANTIKENIAYLNERKQIDDNHSYYNNVAIRVKDTANILFTRQEMEQVINGLPYQMRSFDFNNIGIELVAEWYKRNLFIYRNIIENTQSNDRVLIIFGYGHTYYLNQFLGDNPEFKLENPNNYLSR